MKLRRLLSDDNTVTSSSTPADNNDEVTNVDDGDGADLTDTDTAAAAATADDRDDDIVSRNLQKRQSVQSYLSSYISQSLIILQNSCEEFSLWSVGT